MHLQPANKGKGGGAAPYYLYQNHSHDALKKKTQELFPKDK